MKCPNPACPNHTPTSRDWYVKHGSFTPKGTRQKTQRYKCKEHGCGKLFSAHTGKSTAWQKKPMINTQLFKMLVSGVSLRRCAEILGVDYNTVRLHFDQLAKQAQELHAKHLLTIKTSYVQVDELETFVHARAKCLSVPVAVRPKTGEILAFAVARMPAKGKLAAIGAAQYAWTNDERPTKFTAMLMAILPCLKPTVAFRSDAKGAYKTWISAVAPHATLVQAAAGKKLPLGSPKAFDELFAINNTFARMRHDMNRLARKTWSTTKTIEGLEKHLWLYVAWNNKYTMR
jgi:transposase-like protein